METSIKQKVEIFFSGYPVRKYKKGEILIFTGDIPSHVFYVLDGSARQYDVSPKGDEVVVNIFKPPAFFPMNYVINRRPNDYIYDAAENITARVAPVDDVLDFIRDNPDVTFDLLARVYNGIDGVLRRQFYLMSSDASDRLAYELTLSCRRIGEKQSNGSYLIKLSEAELAARVGLSRETVSRRLQDMKKQGLIQIKTNGLVITDLPELEKMLAESA